VRAATQLVRFLVAVMTRLHGADSKQFYM
jgi:hypothetical protein